MNLGSKNKWIEAMQSGQYLFGEAQLRWDDVHISEWQKEQGIRMRCDPWGVLLDFLNKDGWEKHELHGWTFEGEVFKMPESYRKRCKMKTEWGEFTDDEGIERSFVELVDSVDRYEPVIDFIEKYYQFL